MKPVPIAFQPLPPSRTHSAVCLYSTKKSTIRNLTIDELEMRPITAKESIVRLSQIAEACRMKIERNEEKLKKLTADHPLITPVNRLGYMRVRNRIMKNLRIQRHVLKKSLEGVARTNKHLGIVYEELERRGSTKAKNVHEVSGGGCIHGDIVEVPQADCAAQRDPVLSGRKTPPVSASRPGPVSREYISETERRVYLFCGQERKLQMRVFPF